eukprot:jgi/Chrzof1/5416/Cz16g02070.t1
MPHFNGLLGLMCVLLASTILPCQCARLNGLSLRAGVATADVSGEATYAGGRSLQQSDVLPADSTSAFDNSTLFNDTASLSNSTEMDNSTMFDNTTSLFDNTTAMDNSTAVDSFANDTAVSPDASLNDTLIPSADNETVISDSNDTVNDTSYGTPPSVIIPLPADDAGNNSTTSSNDTSLAFPIAANDTAAGNDTLPVGIDGDTTAGNGSD